VIRRDQPVKMYGYASALFLLAAYFERESLAPPSRLRAVFTTAEPLFDFQRKTIEAALGCPVGVEYGCRDGAWSPSNALRAGCTSPPRECTWRSSTRTPTDAARSP